MRRSSSFNSEYLVEDYLEYAKLVRDEEVVYEYMTDNRIGINEPEFWLAWLKLMEKQGEFVKIAKLLKEIRYNSTLKQYF